MRYKLVKKTLKNKFNKIFGIKLPTLEWNRRWEKVLNEFLEKNPKKEKYFGEGWGNPEIKPFLKKICENFVIPYVNKNHIAIEIGSGGGRWTQYLLNFKKVFCVEFNQNMFQYLIDRFGTKTNLSFCLTNGTDFPGIAKDSIDYAFSFGTFVHLDNNLIKEYLVNLRQVMKKDSNVVIQYSEKTKPLAARKPGFSNTTAKIMRKLVLDSGFSIISEDLDSLPHSNVIHFRPK